MKPAKIRRLLSLMLCLCMVLSLVSGAVFAEEATNAVAVTISGMTTQYATYEEALSAVAYCTKENEAEIKLLRDVALGENVPTADSGVFTLDLNGFELSGTQAGQGTLSLYGDAEVTVIDSGEGGKITGYYAGILVMNGGQVTVEDGIISAINMAVYCIHSNSCVTINAGTVSSTTAVVVSVGGNVIISGGTVTGYLDCDVDEVGTKDGNITLTLGAEGSNGATFPEGIKTVDGYTLGDLTGECSYICFGRDGEVLTFDPAATLLEGNIVVTTDHAHVWEEEVVAATCTQKGYTHYGCTACSYSYIVDETAPTGHSFGEGGICTFCGISGEIIINMVDSYGDGWNGNAIEVYEGDNLVGTATLEGDESEGTYKLPYDSEKGYRFVWVQGSYADECSFQIILSGEELFSKEDASTCGDGETIYFLCRHNYGEGVETEATCTEKGGIYYSCSKCGDTYIENETPALGHDLGDDGVCTVCSKKPAELTINMVDSYGDSWNGNGIKIYNGDQLINTATIITGGEATWTDTIDLLEDYTFRWSQGGYSDECSFEVLLDGVSVIKADNCTGYEDGELLFSIIDGKVVAGAAVQEGYMKIYFQNNWLWSDVSLHYWGSELAENTEWAGIPMNYYGNDGTYDIYALAVPGDVDGIVINGVKNDGSGNRDQTPDIVSDWYDGICYYMLWDDGNKVGSFNIDDIESGGGEPGEPGEDPIEDSVVYVGGVALGIEEYLDLEGNVTTMRPEGGYAYYDDDGYLILFDYSYEGTGYSFTKAGETYTALIYTEKAGLEIEVLGSNHLHCDATEDRAFGIIGGDVENGEFLSLTLSGNGTMKLSGETMHAIRADHIEVDGGIWNIEAAYGIGSFNSNSSLTVDGGELHIVTTAEEWCETLWLGNVTLNNGEVTLSCAGGTALDVETLTVNGGYLEVKKGGMTAWSDQTDELIVLGENVSITAPEGAEIGSYTYDEDMLIHTIYDADGNIADAFVIEAPAEEFEVIVYNDYGTADKIILSNPIAKVGRYYKTTISATVGTDVAVWGVYSPKDDVLYGNGIFYFDEETHTLLVDGEYVSEGLKIEAVPLVNLTVHMNGGSCNDNWEHTLEPDENGTIRDLREWGETYYLYVDWDETTDEPVPDANRIFEREGYTLVGYNTAADGSGTFYPMDYEFSLTEDTELYLQWKSNTPEVEPQDGVLKEENGGLYYYVDGKRSYAGLIEIDGAYYYIRSNGQAVTGRTYWITKTNDLLPADNYTFDADGKLCKKNGLVEENGGLYYYVDGKLSYAGLIEIDGAYYYIRSNGQAVTDRTYWITKTNDLLPADNYAFGADGKLTDNRKNGLIEEDGGLYYYVDDQLNYAGLIEIDGAYYYVRSNGQAVTDRTYWITKTNDLLPAANYAFGADGKLILN